MDITLQTFLEYLVKRWWIILLCTLLGFILTFIASSYVIQKHYSSSLIMTYEESGTDNNETLKVRRIATAVLALSENVYLENLSEYLSTNNYATDDSISPELLLTKVYTAKELSNMIEGTYNKDTLSVSIVVTAIDSRDAKIIAEDIISDKMLQELCDIAKIQSNNYTRFTVLSAPKENVYPVSPNVALYSIAGIFIGLIIGVLIGLLMEKLDVRVKNEDDLLSKYDLPVLGIIPNFPEFEEKK